MTASKLTRPLRHRNAKRAGLGGIRERFGAVDIALHGMTTLFLIATTLLGEVDARAADAAGPTSIRSASAVQGGPGKGAARAQVSEKNSLVGTYSQGATVAGGPINDECPASIAIQDGRTQISNIGATTNGPAHTTCGFIDDLQINNDIWFDYTATCTGELEISMCASPRRENGGFDTKLALYLGGTCPTTEAPLVCNDDECIFPANALASAVATRVEFGQRYKLRVGGYRPPSMPASQGVGVIDIACQPDFPECVGGVEDCCGAHASGGCSTQSCCELVCSIDPACCRTGWNSACANRAATLCLACGGGGGGECANCIPINTGEPFLGSTTGATGTNVSACAGPNDVADVWHCWRPTCTGLGTVELCNSAFDTTLSVFGSCGGAELACNDDACADPNGRHSRVEFPVSAGTNYFVRIAGYDGETGDYILQTDCAPGPVNDNCLQHEAISASSFAFDTRSATTDGPVLPEDCNEGNGVFLGADIWYTYTPDCSGVMTFSTCGDADFDTRLALYEGCSCPVTNARLVACADDSGGCRDFTTELTAEVQAGTCYMLRVGGFAEPGDVAEGQGRLTVSSCGVAPPNAHCALAQATSLPTTRVGDNTLAVNDCPLFVGYEVWESFVLTATADVTLDYCGTSPRFENAWLNLVGECPCTEESLSSEASFCSLCPDGNVVMKWFCLAPGTYYYPVLSERGSRGTYTINIASSACTNNNSCALAARISEGVSLFSTRGATMDGPSVTPACSEGAGIRLDNDIWYDYTAPCDGVAIVSTCGTALYNTRLAAYCGTSCPVANNRIIGCNDNGLDCEGDTSHMTINVSAGSDYKIRLGGPAAANEGNGCVEVRCVPSEPVCPLGLVAFMDPANGLIDARQPTPPGGGALQTPRILRVAAPSGADDRCFSMCESSAQGLSPNAIVDVSSTCDGTYVLQLERGITPGAQTSVRYLGAPDAVGRFSSHPANVNADTSAGALDIISMVDILNSVISPAWGAASSDIDRSGLATATDIIRLIDLLNGAGEFDPWLNTARPTGNQNCP